jgi:ankyrin repeat protein
MLAKKEGITNINLNYSCEDQWSPLHYAVINKNKDAVQILIDGGALVDQKGKGGVTPLFLANLE